MKQKQNKKAFSELIQKNQGIIHEITRVYENNWVDREDLFQEICLQLWKSYPNFREEAQFSTWMYRVALNTAIGNISKKKNGFSFESRRETDRIPEQVLNDNVLAVVIQNIETQQKQDRITKVLVSFVLVFGFVLLAVILKKIGR